MPAASKRSASSGCRGVTGDVGGSLLSALPDAAALASDSTAAFMPSSAQCSSASPSNLHQHYPTYLIGCPLSPKIVYHQSPVSHLWAPTALPLNGSCQTIWYARTMS